MYLFQLSSRCSLQCWISPMISYSRKKPFFQAAAVGCQGNISAQCSEKGCSNICMEVNTIFKGKLSNKKNICFFLFLFLQNNHLSPKARALPPHGSIAVGMLCITDNVAAVWSSEILCTLACLHRTVEDAAALSRSQGQLLCRRLCRSVMDEGERTDEDAQNKKKL